MSINRGVKGGMNDMAVANPLNGSLITGNMMNIGIITGIIAGNVSDCASLGSLTEAPMAASDEPIITIAATIYGVFAQPTYIIEDLGQLPGTGGGASSIVTGFAPPAAVAGDASMYRITARGIGRTDTAVAVVQSVYRR